MTALQDIVGESPGILAVREQAARLLERPAAGVRRLPPILVLGETGSGKGLLAATIHRAGPRATGPFIDVNCAAIPETLLEAELFGFERGAFTDARRAKAGLFQVAHGGTLFLDEVGLLPESLQAKLLKVIDERTVRRLGSTQSEAVDLWLIAATSEDLQEAVRARRFREDLYHRLAVVTLRLPPLRERGEDIPSLAEHFLQRACEDYGLPLKRLTGEARAALLAYRWPGNVRELANVMERVALLSEGTAVNPAMLGLSPPGAPVARAPSAPEERRAAREMDAETERETVLTALRAAKWNISRAAVRLGMPRNTLRYKMEKHGLGPETASPRSRGAHDRGLRPSGAAESSSAPAVAPAADAMPAGIRWESRRVTFLLARLVPREEPGSYESGRVMEGIVDKVGSFGGVVDELSATGLIATFGLAPVEGALEHAAFGALAMQKIAARARGDNPGRPAVVVALHTGLTRVGRHREGVSVDGDARRHAWRVLEGLAARAEPGAVMVSSEAAALLARRFELVPMDAATVAGSEGGAHRLVGARDVEQGLTVFVGREAELGLLGQRFEQAGAGHGQLVSIVGEPGIGKSRLLREFRRRVREGAIWVEGHARSVGHTIPFHPLVDLVRRAFGMDEADPPALIIEKIERAVLRLGDDLRPAIPFMRHLLSVDPGDARVLQLDPKLRRAEIFDAMRRLFVRTAERRPIVVVWEDLHWADQATEEFVAGLADSLAAQRSLMIVTHRPGYAPPLGDRIFHTRLSLTALSAADSATMARELLGTDALPETLRALLARRTEGNPFFVEEVLRSLQETEAVRREGGGLVVARDLDGLVVPATIQDVIRARVERLGDAARQILDAASVVGREFGRRLIDHVVAPAGGSEGPLRELLAAELVQEKSPFPELTYAFTHALTHEVVYGSLDPTRRAELHRRVGLAIETLHADRAGQEEVLAHHFSQAGEWPKALAYLSRAGAKAARAFAVREARTLYDQALEATRRPGTLADPRAVSEIHEARSGLYFVVSEFDRSRAEAERVMALARQAGDRAREASALAAIGWAAMWARDLDGAVAHAREAIAVAGPGGSDTLARAQFTLGFARAVSGGLDEARGAIDQALVTSLGSREWTARSLSLSAAGLLKSWEGEYDAASRLQAEGLVLARDHHLLIPLLFNFFLHGMTLTGKGDYEGALALYREGLAFAEKVGDEAIHHRLLNCLGWLHAELGDLDGAIEFNRQSAEVGRRRNDPGTFPNAEANLGEVYLAKGDLAEAAEHLEIAYRYWDNPRTSQWMRWRYSIRLFASLGELWLARGHPERATEFSDRCLDLATRTSSRRNLVKGWRLRGEIALARRQLDDAETAFREALAVAEAIGNPTQLWTTHAALGRLHAARGRHDLAAQAHRAGRDVIERVKRTLRDERLRASLDRGHAVRRLFELAGPA